MYIVTCSEWETLIQSLSHTHSEHWAVSSMYFLLWVAVQSLHLAASSSCILLLHLWSQNLHFSKSPKGFKCVWKYEKPCTGDCLPMCHFSTCLIFMMTCFFTGWFSPVETEVCTSPQQCSPFQWSEKAGEIASLRCKETVWQDFSDVLTFGGSFTGCSDRGRKRWKATCEIHLWLKGHRNKTALEPAVVRRFGNLGFLVFSDPELLDCSVQWSSSENDERTKKYHSSPSSSVFLHFRRHLIWEVILFCKNSLKHLRAQVSEQKTLIQHLDLGTFIDVPRCMHTFCLSACAGLSFLLAVPCPTPYIYLARSFYSSPNASSPEEPFLIPENLCHLELRGTLYLFSKRPFWIFNPQEYLTHGKCSQNICWMKLSTCFICLWRL